jgi:ArsR family transcriptional regulator
MDRLLTLLRAAAEDTRLRILALAAREDLTVSDYVHVLGQSQPRVSRHLKLLVEGGLLERFREAQFTRFRLVTGGDDAGLVREFVRRLDPKSPRLATDRARLDALQQRRQTAAVRFFRDNAQRWDELRALHVADREIERALAHHLPINARRLLDIGTGTGRLLEVLAPKVERAIGIDQSREMLALARANLARAGLDNAEIRQADMYALPFEAESFDVVTIHHVLHYAEDPAAALAEAARVVRPGGVVLVVDFQPHDLVELKREHAHVHLGFADNQVQGWLRSAGLNPLEPIDFPGRRLMTVIWRGERDSAQPASRPSNLTPNVAQGAQR